MFFSLFFSTISPIIFFFFSFFILTNCESKFDSFGFKKIFPTKPSTIEWNSNHWNNGIPREVDWFGDKYDPLSWTEDHSAGDAYPDFKIDGNGVLQMMASGARFHINSLKGNQTQFYKNIEFTGYFKRGEASLNGKDNGGIVVGVRSGPLGHGSQGGNDCDASTYYARVRHDGKWDFEKEWKHPWSFYQSEGVLGRQAPLWGGEKLPCNIWIGMKYLVYNIFNENNEENVKLVLYIDRKSNGDPSKAEWEFIGEAVDNGKEWSGYGDKVGKIDGCKEYNGLENAYSAIIEGHGTVLMRTDGKDDNVIQGEYKFVTIREIDPNGSFDEKKEGEENKNEVNKDSSVAVKIVVILFIAFLVGILVLIIYKKTNLFEKIGFKKSSNSDSIDYVGVLGTKN